MSKACAPPFPYEFSMPGVHDDPGATTPPPRSSVTNMCCTGWAPGLITRLDRRRVLTVVRLGLVLIGAVRDYGSGETVEVCRWRLRDRSGTARGCPIVMRPPVARELIFQLQDDALAHAAIGRLRASGVAARLLPHAPEDIGCRLAVAQTRSALWAALAVIQKVDSAASFQTEWPAEVRPPQNPDSMQEHRLPRTRRPLT